MSTQLATITTRDHLAHLEPLVASARRYAQKARADETRRAYGNRWAHFERWCEAHGLEALPASPETVAMYLSARADEHLELTTEGERKRTAPITVSTLAQTLAAIAKAHKLAGLPSPRDAERVTETFAGIRRTLGSAQTQKAPVLADQLRAMAATMPDTLLGVRDRALLLVGFAGAFRRSELVAIEVRDLRFTSDGLVATVRKSKTDQEGHGVELPIPYGRAAATCPVRSLQRWLERSGITDGPVFRAVDRHENIGAQLAGSEVARVVKRTALRAGLDPAQFAGHSLRAGLATSAAKAGRPAHVIAKQTRHVSTAMVARYIRSAQLFDECAAEGLL